MNSTMFKIIISSAFLICIGCNKTFTLDQQEDVGYLDLFLLSLLADTQDYVLAI